MVGDARTDPTSAPPPVAPTVGPPSRPSPSSLLSPAPVVLGTWLAARLLVAVGFWISDVLAARVRLPLGQLHLDEGLLFWDGAYYRSIADQGYDTTPLGTLRFFPGFPLAGRAFGPILGGRTDVALVVVNNLSALVALYLLWQIAERLGFDRNVAARAVAVLGLFPAAAVTAFGYAEGPMLAMVTAAALLLIDRRPGWAALPLVAAGLLRPTGVLLSVAVAVLAIRATRSDRRNVPSDTVEVAEDRRSPRWWAWLPAAAAPAAGLACYLGWIASTGASWTTPLDDQRQYRAGFREPITRFVSAVASTISGNFRDVYNVGFAIVLLVALVIAVRRRVPVAWTAYLGVGLLIALAANNIDSLGRYGLLLVPAWPIGLALVAEKRWQIALLISGSGVGLVWFTVAARLGYMIP